jgi:hypothetical protein
MAYITVGKTVSAVQSTTVQNRLTPGNANGATVNVSARSAMLMNATFITNESRTEMPRTRPVALRV